MKAAGNSLGRFDDRRGLVKKEIYARSDLRHLEETWLGEQGNSREGQGDGHCRRQGSVQFAR